MKLEFSGQIFEKYSNTKFHDNPSSGSRVVSRGLTETKEPNSRFSQFWRTRPWKFLAMTFFQCERTCSVPVFTARTNTRKVFVCIRNWKLQKLASYLLHACPSVYIRNHISVQVDDEKFYSNLWLLPKFSSNRATIRDTKTCSCYTRWIRFISRLSIAYHEHAPS